MRTARNQTGHVRVEGDELVDGDVPAAVVCAHCGEADCPGGCHDQMKSGVVAMVPWERPGAPALARLWATARATTFDSERFFESLPDGPILPALKFAVASELIAATAMASIPVAAVAFVAPAWVGHVLLNDGVLVARLLSAAIPGLASLLVAAHAVHGWALDFGARRSGVRRATRRALRFGLYAAGWDLVIGPLGAAIVTAKEGWRASLPIAGLGIGLPGRSAAAFLRGCYHLEGEDAAPAMRASWVAAGLATAVGAIAVLGAIAALLLA